MICCIKGNRPEEIFLNYYHKLVETATYLQCVYVCSYRQDQNNPNQFAVVKLVTLPLSVLSCIFQGWDLLVR